MNGRAPAALLSVVLGIAALIVSWAYSNPVGAASDEPSHYVKAIGVASGDWVGISVPDAEIQRGLAPSVAQRPFFLESTRAVHLPVRLRPGRAGCTDELEVPAAGKCLTRPVKRFWGMGTLAFTYLAGRPPVMYWPAGVVMLQQRDAAQAFTAGRLMFGLMALVLMALGLSLLMAGAKQPLLTLIAALVALTPMVVFTVSAINDSAVEVSAGFATICAALHLAFSRRYPRIALASLAITGSVLALSRTLGPVWVVLIVATMALLLGWRQTIQLARRYRRYVSTTIIALAVASAATVWWDVSYQPAPSTALAMRVSDFVNGFRIIPNILKQMVGVFGWVDTTQSPVTYVAWAAMALTLLVAAWLTASRRERLVLIGWIAGAVLLIPLLNAVEAVPGQSVQGRHLLPIVLIVPLMCAALVGRRMVTPRVQLWGAALVALFALLQFLAVYLNGRHYAVGPHASIFYFLHAIWSPPYGWLPWIALAAAGAVALLAPAAALLSTPRPGAGAQAQPGRTDAIAATAPGRV